MVQFAILGTHDDILSTLKRVIEKTEGWHATITKSEDELKTLVDSQNIDFILLSAGIDESTENRLLQDNSLTDRGIKVILHYGGGSGLLKNEIFTARPDMAKSKPGTGHEVNESGDGYIIHRSDSRVYMTSDLAKSYPTFSFGDYYNPERLSFGALRVFNDDVVEGSKGFGIHPHDNMEIISVPISGRLEHKDTLGNQAIVESYDIQVMNAGTGLFHSEFNDLKDEESSFLQIWIYPNQRNTPADYNKITFNTADRTNKFQQLVSPNKQDNCGFINQNAWINIAVFDVNREEILTPRSGNGLYIFVINGSILINDHLLNTRDGIGLWESEKVLLKMIADKTEILVIEVPMDISYTHAI